MDIYNMREHHVSDDMMYKAAGWERVEQLVQKASATWLGHVARMNIDRRPKQALFGWWGGRTGKGTSVVTHPRFLAKAIDDGGIPAIDWFRMAQKRGTWRSLVQKGWPTQKRDKEMEAAINAWRPGQPLLNSMETSGDAAEGAEEEEEAINDKKRQCPVCQW